MVKFDGKKFRRMINCTRETSINLFLSIQSCTYVSQDREGIHIYTSFPKRFCRDAGDAVLRNCLEDNPKSIIHGCKKHRVIRKPERLSRLPVSFRFPYQGRMQRGQIGCGLRRRENRVERDE